MACRALATTGTSEGKRGEASSVDRSPANSRLHPFEVRGSRCRADGHGAGKGHP